MKRLLLPIMTALFALPIFGINQLKNINPSNVVFTWDAHDTVVKKDGGKRFKMAIKTAWGMIRSRTARHILNDHLDQKGLCGGEVLEHEYHQLAHEYIEDAQFVLAHGNKKLAERFTEKERESLKNAGQQINPVAKDKYTKKAQWYHKRAKQARKGKGKELAKKYREKAKRMVKLAHLFHNFELSYGKMKGTTELLTALKARGYTQHYVASNIGINHFEHLKAKFPEIFNETMIQDGLTVNAWQDPVLKKPDHAYFYKLQADYNPNKDKTVVFIDDKQENVDAANKCGIIGLLTKDVKYLVKQLNDEGIDLRYSKHKMRMNGKKHTLIQVV